MSFLLLSSGDEKKLIYLGLAPVVRFKRFLFYHGCLFNEIFMAIAPIGSRPFEFDLEDKFSRLGKNFYCAFSTSFLLLSSMRWRKFLGCLISLQSSSLANIACVG